MKVTRSRQSQWRVIESCLTRWRVEETIRFIKQSYRLEDIRLLSYERLRSMAALVMAAAYFACVHLGKSVKLKILLRHIYQASKRIYGIPEFRFYAIADDQTGHVRQPSGNRQTSPAGRRRRRNVAAAPSL